MKLSFKLDLGDLERELVAGIKQKFDAAFEASANKADQEAQAYAASKLKSGLSKWIDGYSFKRISKDMYVLAISGELADMMEDGIEVGQISKMIRSGNRWTHNVAEGKDYVDVPMPDNNVTVNFHKDADSLTKSFQSKEIKLSDLKTGVRKETRLVKRVNAMAIESRKTMNDPNPAFLSIRRVTKDSVWPKQKFQGAKSFEEAAKNFADNFTQMLESSL